MAVQPSRVNARDVSAFLALVRERSESLSRPSAADDVAFFERKADLLSRIAAESTDSETHAVAANARTQLDTARARLAGGER